jgi:hypothetical protein
MTTTHSTKIGVTAGYRALFGHAWLLVTFRHRGTGMDLTDGNSLLLGIFASLFAGVPTLIPGVASTNIMLSYCQAALIAGVAIGVFYAVLGRRDAAAMSLLIMVSSSIETALLLTNESAALPILGMKAWFLAAQGVFFFRADRSTVASL